MDEFTTRVAQLIDAGCPMSANEVCRVLSEIYDEQVRFRKETGAYAEWFKKNRVKRIIRIIQANIAGYDAGDSRVSRTLYKKDIAAENEKLRAQLAASGQKDAELMASRHETKRLQAELDKARKTGGDVL